MVMRRCSQGYSLSEIIIVLAIVAIMATLTVVRFNQYKARGACRSASQILMQDLKFQQQRAFTLESEQGITISPGGDASKYTVWSSDGEIPPRKIDLRNLFSTNVRFAPGQSDKILIFYPWTADATNEWSYVKTNGTNDIVIRGGDLTCIIKISPEGKLSLDEK